jgi:hypothetical protein
MGAGEIDMKERISLLRTEYSILKEDINMHGCG